MEADWDWTIFDRVYEWDLEVPCSRLVKQYLNKHRGKIQPVDLFSMTSGYTFSSTFFHSPFVGNPPVHYFDLSFLWFLQTHLSSSIAIFNKLQGSFFIFYYFTSRLLFFSIIEMIHNKLYLSICIENEANRNHVSIILLSFRRFSSFLFSYSASSNTPQLFFILHYSSLNC